MKVPRIKFDSLHYIRMAVCTFQPLVSVRYRTKHQYHHSSKINSTPVPIVHTPPKPKFRYQCPIVPSAPTLGITNTPNQIEGHEKQQALLIFPIFITPFTLRYRRV